MIRLSLFIMAGLTFLIAMGLRWREEKLAVQQPKRAPRLGWVAAQKHKINRWVTAAALAALATILLLGGLNWLRVWRDGM